MIEICLHFIFGGTFIIAIFLCYLIFKVLRFIVDDLIRELNLQDYVYIVIALIFIEFIGYIIYNLYIHFGGEIYNIF